MAQRSKGARTAAAAIAFVAVSAIALVAVPVIAQAQVVPAKKKAQQGPAQGPGVTGKPDDGQATKKAYESGVASYKSGKFEPASQSLSIALRGGGLQSSEMARAMYMRGLSYRKLGKSALAISDLTSSIWLKNGLNDAERADAMSNRSAAYKEAGLEEPGAVTTVASAPSAQSSASPPTSAPAATTSSPWNIFSSGTLSSSSQPSAPAAPASGIQQPVLSAAPTETAQAAPQSSSSSSGGIGGFFGNMFGGTAATASPTSATTSGATTSGATTSGLTTSSTSGEDNTSAGTAHTATSSWDSATEVAVALPSDAPPAQVSKTLRTASIEGVTPAAAAPAVPVAAPLKGKFKMHIAAVRSREEADALAAKIVAEHGTALGGRVPVVDEATIGSMGKFYRVRVAPFMTAEDARSPCKALKAGGYDCLVVMK